LGDN
jgi:hypothetical protein